MASRALDTKTPGSKRVFLNIEIHPELRKGMSLAATQADQSMKSWLHHLLCHELGRMDLYHQVPDAS